MFFAETSAKSGENVDRLFVDVAKHIFNRYKDRLHKMFEEETSEVGSRSNSVEGRKIIRASNDFGSVVQPTGSFVKEKKLRKKKDTCNC